MKCNSRLENKFIWTNEAWRVKKCYTDETESGILKTSWLFFVWKWMRGGGGGCILMDWHCSEPPTPLIFIYHMEHGTTNGNKVQSRRVCVLYCCSVPDNFPVCFCCCCSQLIAIYLCTHVCNYPSNLVTVRRIHRSPSHSPDQCVPLYWIVMATRSKAVVIAPKLTPWHRFPPHIATILNALISAAFAAPHISIQYSHSICSISPIFIFIE